MRSYCKNCGYCTHDCQIDSPPSIHDDTLCKHCGQDAGDFGEYFLWYMQAADPERHTELMKKWEFWKTQLDTI
jgi:hypothetical protein